MSYIPMAPNCLPMVQTLARAYPQEFADCHRPELGERAWAFIKRLAWELHTKVDPRFGLNAKRGNPNDPSMDAVSYLNGTASQAGGVEIIDAVGSAGTSAATPAWLDVTQATIDKGDVGGWIAPQPVDDAVDPPVVPPVVPPTSGCASCDEALALLQTVQQQQRDILFALSQTATKADVQTCQDALWGLIANEVIAVHLDDLKRRVDGVQASVDALQGKRTCRFLS